jgi:hypothetical protein
MDGINILDALQKDAVLAAGQRFEDGVSFATLRCSTVASESADTVSSEYGRVVSE